MMIVRTLGLGLAVLLSGTAMGQLYGRIQDMPVPGQGRVAVEASGTDVRIDQRLGEFIPRDVVLTDEDGRTRKIEEFLGRKPLILTFVFYDCKGTCLDTLRGLSGSLRRFKRERVGVDFDVLTVSIDPKETPAHARSAKQRTLDLYTHRDKTTQEGWHFFVGSEAEVRKLANAAGFVYKYDASNGDIVHPTGMMVLTPAGQLSRYWLSTEYPPSVLLQSLREAGAGQIGVRDDRPFYMSCIEINPMTGQRTLNVLNTLKVLGAITVLSMVGFIVHSTVLSRRKPRESKPV